MIGSTIRPASFCGCVGFKPSVNALNREGSHDYQSQSCTGILGASLADVWQVAHEIVSRVGGDAGTPGLQGPDEIPAAAKPRRLAVLETAGWDSVSLGAKQRFDECVTRLKSAGIEIRTRHNDDKVAALESSLGNAAELAHRCNGWETRWLFRSMRDRDAGKLSRNILQRAQKYEDLTLAEHRADLKARARVRAVYADLAAICDAWITLAAPGGAPEGIAWTGNPGFAVPASLLGVPALSLPLFEAERDAAWLTGDRLFRPRRGDFFHCLLAVVFVAGALSNHSGLSPRKKRNYAAPAYTNRLPTAVGVTTSSPNVLTSAAIARQPVQCPAAIVVRPNSRSAPTVSGMIFSVWPER